jgi:hypothetical protein
MQYACVCLRVCVCVCVRCLLHSGTANTSGDLAIDIEVDNRPQLMVRNVKPPFLDGRVSFSRQTEMVSTVKDPTSDFAVSARKGSELLKRELQQATKMKMRKRWVWLLGVVWVVVVVAAAVVSSSSSSFWSFCFGRPRFRRRCAWGGVMRWGAMVA